jgi:hypothetical protein
MGTLSVSIPDDLRARMIQMEEVNWSAVARKAFEEKVKQIDFLTKIASKSKLTEEDAEAIGAKINKSMAQRFKEMKKCN